MANQTKSNPWIIDTTSASVIYSPPFHGVQFEFIEYTQDTDDVEIWDRNGNIIAYLNGASDLRTVRSGKISWVEGIKVPVTKKDSTTNMAHGKLLIYFE